MFQIRAKLLYNKRVNNNYFHCAFLAPAIAKEVTPGQFVNIKLTDRFEPLLRRPFSVHRVRGKDTEILYEVVGLGTEILSRKKRGEYLDIIGPLGSGFDLRLETCDPRTMLVGGGIGVAPLLFLAEKLAKRKALVLIGAKTKSQILCEKEFKELGCAVKIATDNGSRGFKGRVTDLLKHLLLTIDHRLLTIYACGPRPMLKEVSRISKEYNIAAQISLEEHMACGIGACLGCVIKVKSNKEKGKSESEYKRVCKEGPVFNAEKIVWSNEAQTYGTK